MLIALQSLLTMHCNMLTDIRIAKETGYAGIELDRQKLMRYLAQGFSVDSLLPLFREVPPVGLCEVPDIERQGPEAYSALMTECETACSLAKQLGCPMVQLLSGPLDPNGPYKGLAGISWPEMRKLTVKNLKALADIGKAHNIRFFFEALTWAPLHKLDQALEVIDAAERDNLGIVVDFWHFWNSGDTAEDVAKLNKDLIYCVHFCDSLDHRGERGACENGFQRGRDVWPGGGRIPLKEWVDAVRATGFDGYWSCELLSPKYWELDPWKSARDSKAFLEYLLI